ncbi:MAG: sigma-54-dependent Fis family transcriptional regulator [Planctomycetes bacterium]|nr:sigma-54-dependent Fis family transcriptional regulator [Planctomycetota bacterium]
MTSQQTVLIVHPPGVVRAALVAAMREAGLRTSEADDLLSAGRLLAEENPDAVVTELRLADGSGSELVARAAGRDDAPVIVAISEKPETRETVIALRSGALDVIERPCSPERVLATLQPALLDRARRMQRRRTEARPASNPRPAIVGQSPAIKAVMEQVARAASAHDTTVLVQGESGTGKELVARAIHYDGPRNERPFMAINCAALNESLLEAELFGYEKGAFTGANGTGRKGLFEAADGGTVFLDEIGEMSAPLQAKLLRVLQESSFKRVGGTQDVNVDVRIIAATNRDLWEEVALGRFRKDLYFRLNVLPIRMPTLQERQLDVAPMAQHFLEHFARALRKPVQGLSADALRMLQEHSWPGNVRELRNVCEYAVIVCDGALVEPRHLALSEHAQPRRQESSTTSTATRESSSVSTINGCTLTVKDRSLRSMEVELIRMVLEQTRFNIARTARELGINRSTLYNKMKDYGLCREERHELRQTV